MASTGEENVARFSFHNFNSLAENPAPPKDLQKSCLKWNFIFTTSCVFAVLLDPLFLYIPILNDHIKCLKLDNNLKITALILRSVTDLFYIANIIFQVCRFENCSPSIKRFLPESCSSKLITSLIKSFRELLPEVSNEVPKPSITKEIRESSIIVDILAILPLPQVVILIFFSKMRASRSFRKLMNFLVMVQYVPRVLRIYISCKKSKKPFKGQIALWVKGVLNFFLYILVSHVLGAFWYFFAIQRMTSCWQHACRYENGCDPTSFDCNDHHTLRNITVLNDLCSINPSNTDLFDFGIYLNVLQSGILWSTNYPLKFLNSFSWGLRNLSSLASNLQPSTNTWEILFVTFISVIGLLLFVYLIGNLQTYVLLDTERLESHRRKMKIEQKLTEKVGPDVEKWLFENGIPMSTKSEVMSKVRQELEENSDIDVKKEILSILPHELQNYIESCTPLSRLRKVPRPHASLATSSLNGFSNNNFNGGVTLQQNDNFEVPKLRAMDKQVLKAMAEHLLPVYHGRDFNIIQENRPLSMMFFVTRGEVMIKNNGKGRAPFFGEELVEWVLDKSFPEMLPLSTCTATVVSNDAEILYLKADVLKNFVSNNNFASHFSRIASEIDLFTFVRLTRLKKVKIFQKMEKEVLEALSKLLKPKTYRAANTYIIREKEPLEMMFFVVSGVVSIERSDSTTIEGPQTREMGGFYGEELVHWVTTWASHSYFPAELPLATGSALRGPRPVKILALTADDLKSVVSDFKSKLFTRETQITLPPYLPSEPLTGDLLTMLKNVERLKHMDEQVLKEISEHLRVEKYQDQYIIGLNESVEKMFFILRGVVAVTNEYWTEHRNEAERSNHSGDDLIDYWVRSKDTAFPKELPISALSFRAIGEVKVLVLMANDLARVQPCRIRSKTFLRRN
ncbi:cyclic nucleotide-gated ion channel 1-like isoform X6 [Prunus dulcis]|uniref:cyclic nucleotide-gated ion channel 1-like isoform X6 n=1 Tax=Prunus dulcis TaxID=3755 RepID=UPI001481FC76|nr:cyclic nucleotide-gated ion channel 1-like isoform X6 [Prunus dulcis]